MRSQLIVFPFAFAALALYSSAGLAQNTSSVFSPDVVKGRHQIEYRGVYDVDAERYTQRIHYQYGLTDYFRGRAILTQNMDGEQDFDFRYARLEGLWQFLENEKAWIDSALRFELQLVDGDDPPHRFRIGWTGKVDFNEYWQARANFLTGREFGENSSDGWLLEARGQVTRKLTDHIRLGVDYYGDLNDTEDIGGFDDQEHQIGPILKFTLGAGWKGQFGPVFGMSDAAADAELRLFLIKEF